MCSIGGFISEHPIPANYARRLSTGLLWYGRDRGKQSGGVAIWNTPAHPRSLKQAVDPSALTLTSDYHNLFDQPIRACLTHTRSPTSGGLGHAQAQPFTQGPVTTIHNGMFFDEQSLIDRWNINTPSGVDSELVTSFLAAHDPMQLPSFIESTVGPSSIAAMYEDDLYLIRSGNPCVWSTLLTPEDIKICIFASTEAQLLDALAYTWLLPSNMGKPKSTEEGVLLLMDHTGPSALTDPIKHDDQGWTRWMSNGYDDNEWNLPGMAYGYRGDPWANYDGPSDQYKPSTDSLSNKIASLYLSTTRKGTPTSGYSKDRKESRPNRRHKGNRRGN